MDFNFILKEKPCLGNYKIRTQLYIQFSNSSNIHELCNRMMANVKRHFETQILNCVTSGEMLDILEMLCDKSRCEALTDELILTAKEFYIKSSDFCHIKPLFPFLKVAANAEREGSKVILRTVTNTVQKIGFQHLLHLTSVKGKDKSDSSESSSCSIDLDNENRTCQRAKILDTAKKLYNCHRHNEDILQGTVVHVDILIFLFDADVPFKLAEFCGLIYIDKLLQTSKEKNYEERIKNKCAEIYRLIQTLINQKLVYGANNICITTSSTLYENMTANFKSVIYNDDDEEDVGVDDMSAFANHMIKIDKKDKFLDHLSALTTIINDALLCETGIKGYIKIKRFSCEGQNETDSEKEIISKVNFPVICVIPLYIVRYFSQKKIVEECSKHKKNLF